jgi:hypothetical protein
MRRYGQRDLRSALCLVTSRVGAGLHLLDWKPLLVAGWQLPTGYQRDVTIPRLVDGRKSACIFPPNDL